jgi:hypothetical protein
MQHGNDQKLMYRRALRHKFELWGDLPGACRQFWLDESFEEVHASYLCPECVDAIRRDVREWFAVMAGRKSA